MCEWWTAEKTGREGRSEVCTKALGGGEEETVHTLGWMLPSLLVIRWRCSSRTPRLTLGDSVREGTKWEKCLFLQEGVFARQVLLTQKMTEHSNKAQQFQSNS